MVARSKTLLVLALLLFPLASQAQVASTSVEKSLEEATVNLYCRIKVGGKTFSTSGSGVFIHEKGIILTNAHVAQYFLFAGERGRIKGDCSVRQDSPAEARYEAELLYLSPTWASTIVETTEKKQPRKGTGENDFALLRVTKAQKKFELPDRFPAPALNVAANAAIEEQRVFAIGYPSEGESYKEIQRSLARTFAETSITSIQSFEKPNADILALAPSSASAAGMSGGPVTDRDGNLFGIAVTVSSGEQHDRSLRAITLSYIDRMLRAETGLFLATHLLGAGILQTPDFTAPPYSDVRQTIEKTLRNTR